MDLFGYPYLTHETFMTEERLPSNYGSLVVPLGRATPAEVSDQASLCLEDPMIHAVLEAVDSYAVVLNAQRQILAANSTLLQALSEEESLAFRGLRPGEALGCIHAMEGPDGCGSSRACRGCGALLSVLATQETGQPASAECLISTQPGGHWEAREYAVRTLPLTVAAHRLTLLTLQDISARKRREILERVFIHDLRDSLLRLRGWTELLQSAGVDATLVAEHILAQAGRLTAEVEAHSRLLQAECGELVVEHRTVSLEQIFDELEKSLGVDVAARLIQLPVPQGASPVRTDPAILCRILHNMVMNAIEALPQGGQARIWHEHQAGRSRFVVHNPGCMPPEVADRVFQRSFSTKADRGRGLGTYKMKLLGESVLGGRVGFTTSWEVGTQFFIDLPVDA
jgi:signal transduction histidine kinase